MFKKIEAVAGGPAKKATGSFLDRSVPAVSDRAAFRQYGEALLRTTTKDKDLLKTRIGEWLRDAGNLFSSDPAIGPLVTKLMRRDHRVPRNYAPERPAMDQSSDSLLGWRTRHWWEF
ncbi:MAG: hypothetical protein JW873_05765 [Candidatus Saganbacteria bacterium]|nr:hypothetical protein [Candidatus Saganbacteria bacterium]